MTVAIYRASQVLQCARLVALNVSVSLARARVCSLSDWCMSTHMVAAMVNEAIQKCDVDVRRDMWGGIVLTGGGALLPGLRERLEQVTHSRC